MLPIFANGAATAAFAAAVSAGVQAAQDKPQTVPFEVVRDDDGNITGLVVDGTTVNVASGTQHDPNLDSGTTEVFIGYTKVVGDQHHAFVLAVDATNGVAYITRAGPHLNGAGDFASASSQSSAGGSLAGSSGNAGSGGFGFRRIDAMTDLYTAGIRQDNPANVVAFQRVGTLNQNLGQVASSMASFHNSINGQGIPYWPLGPNSNSYAFSAVQHLGLQAPAAAVGAPGNRRRLGR